MHLNSFFFFFLRERKEGQEEDDVPPSPRQPLFPLQSLRRWDARGLDWSQRWQKKVKEGSKVLPFGHDAVVPHRRVELSISFSSLSGLPPPMKGHVCGGKRQDERGKNRKIAASASTLASHWFSIFTLSTYCATSRLYLCSATAKAVFKGQILLSETELSHVTRFFFFFFVCALLISGFPEQAASINHATMIDVVDVSNRKLRFKKCELLLIFCNRVVRCERGDLCPGFWGGLEAG